MSKDKNLFKKDRFNWELYLINILVPQFIGLMSVFFSGNVSEKYDMLVKPPFAPKGYIFSIAWFIIFFLMGSSAYLIGANKNKDTSKAKFYYSAQLGINFLWSILFFGLDKKFFSFLWIIFLLIVLIKCFIEFRKINKFAAYLLIPYILWVIFATYLNLGFWYLNK